MTMFKKTGLAVAGLMTLALQAGAQTSTAPMASPNTGFNTGVDPSRPTTSTEDTNRDGRIDSLDLSPSAESGIGGTDRTPGSAPDVSENARTNPGIGGISNEPPSAADGANPVTGTPGGMTTGTGINTSPAAPGAGGVGTPSTGGMSGTGTGTSTGTGSMGGGR